MSNLPKEILYQVPMYVVRKQSLFRGMWVKMRHVMLKFSRPLSCSFLCRCSQDCQATSAWEATLYEVHFFCDTLQNYMDGSDSQFPPALNNACSFKVRVNKSQMKSCTSGGPQLPQLPLGTSYDRVVRILFPGFLSSLDQSNDHSLIKHNHDASCRAIY